MEIITETDKIRSWCIKGNELRRMLMLRFDLVFAINNPLVTFFGTDA